jgi:DNA-binding CsgD family transcriptional regulator
MKPIGYHHSIYLALKVSADPVGILALHRSVHQRLFTSSERKYLKELRQTISHALKLQETSFDVLPSERHVGVLVFDERGDSKHVSPLGRRLLFLATQPVIKKGMLSNNESMLHIPAKVTSMVKEFVRNSYEVLPDGQSAGWCVNSLWGSFVFKASWFKKPLNGIAGQVAITIQYQEPTLYRVMRRCEELGLTVRQTEVAIGLFRGLSHEIISRDMCVSAHTVVDHAKKIYEKLGIESKRQLHMVLVSTCSMCA